MDDGLLYQRECLTRIAELECFVEFVSMRKCECMHLVCASCQKYLGEKEPYSDERVSHGMCWDCYMLYRSLPGGVSWEKYVDGFDVPVLILSGEGRVLVANNMAAVLLGYARPEKMAGLPSGVVLSCRHASSGHGCGNNFYCPTCSIRILLKQTLYSQHGFREIRVAMQTEGGGLEITASTTYIDGLVRLVIDGFSSGM